MWECDSTATNSILNSYHVTGPIFTQFMQSFFAAQCALTGEHNWPADATEAVCEDPNYDFIVIGAGSAGSVLANRLSKDSDCNVLLVEAGGDPNLSTEIPQLFYSNMNTEVDWGYKTQPQDGACQGYKTKGCAWPRGKVLGGCSSINAMFYMRGCFLDYNTWAEYGNKGWDYDNVLQYFKKSENLSNYTKEHEQYHGTGGYLSVDNGDDFVDYENIVIDGAVELGMKNGVDLNGAHPMGVMKAPTTTKNGVRCSTARAFLQPIKDRKNLHVIKHAHATKLVFEPGTNVIRGVMLKKNEKDIYVKAVKEVIVSCGAINSPQLLMLSGIGPRKHLEKHDIECIADLPVGENLQDHLFVPTFYTAPGENTYTLPNIAQSFAQYTLNHEGPLATVGPHRVTNFYNTTDPYASCPDIQNHYVILHPGINNILEILKKHDFTDECQQEFERMSKDQWTILVYTVLLHPKSKGKVLLNSTNPMDKPLIYANYFDDPEDMKTIIRAYKQFVVKLGDTKAFKEAGFKLDFLDIDACKTHDKQSDDYVECISKELTMSLYHPVGTVKMGPADDDTAVVDPELRVKKVEGLRVIDASIMPSIVSANTNAPTIMIAEKGADMIIDYWTKQKLNSK